MSAIISDIRDDLQKLDELKRKIGEVKQELMSIDIRIDVDAKNELQGKLQALSSEYEKTFKKMSESRATFIHNIESISDAVDMSKPVEELRKFDEQLVRMCSNLDTYFGGLKDKLESMISALGDGGTVAANIKTNDENVAQIEQLKQQNAELIEQIRQRQEELEKERVIYRQLADAVRTDNVSAIQSLQQATEGVDTKKLLADIKETNVEIGKQEQIVRELEKAYADAKEEAERLKERLAKKESNWGSNQYGHLAEIKKTQDDLLAAEENAARLGDQLGEARYEQNQLNEKLAQYEQQLDNAGTKQERMRTQMMLAREQMARMIAAGQQGTPMFQRIAEEAAKMRKDLALANATMQYFADPNRHLTTLKTGLQGVAGAAGLVTGAIGLFNEESEKVAEIQTKVQSILGIIVGLETTYNMVKKTSNIMLAFEEVKTWALAKARGVQTAATVAATGAQEALNTAMRTNPIGAIISLLAILGTAIFAIVKALTSETEAEKKAREEKEKHIKAIKEQHEQWAKSVASTVSEQIVSYNKLKQKWNELGSDMKAKERFVKDNQTAFHNLGFAINSVTDAENLLVNNTDAVVNAMMARAKATAYEKVIQEQYEKEVRRRIDSDKASRSVENGGSRAFVRVGDKANQKSRAYDNAKKAGYTYREGDVDDEGKWTEQGVKRIEYYNKEYMKRQRDAFKKREQEKRDIAEKEIESTKELAKKELDAEKAAAEKAGIKTYNGENDHSKEDKQEANERADAHAAMTAEEMAYQEKMAKLRREASEAQKTASIAAIKDNAERERAERKAQYEKTIADLKAQEGDIYKTIYEERKKAYETQNKGKKYENTEAGKLGYGIDPKTGNYVMAGTLNTKELEEYQLRMDIIQAKIDEATAKNTRAEEEFHKLRIQNLLDYYKEFGTIQEQNLVIAQEYARKIADAEKAGDKVAVRRYEKERDSQLGGVKANELARGIDFSMITRGLSQAVDTMMQETLQRIRDYKQTDEYKGSKPESKKAISDLERQLLEKGYGGSVSPFGSWKEINKHAEEFDTAVKRVAIATETHEHAIKMFNSASEELDNAINNGASEIEVNMAKAAKEMAQNLVDSTGEELQNAQGEQNVTGQVLIQDYEKVDEGLNQFNNMLSQITSGSLSGFANGVSNLIAMFTKKDSDNGKGLTGLIGQKAGGIISAIISIIDALGDKPVEFIDSLFEKISRAVEEILANLPELVGSIFEGIGNILQGLVSGIARMFGADDLFGVTGNSLEVARTTEELTRQNEILSDRISDLTEAVEENTGTKAIINYDAALEAQKELQENNAKILRENMGEYGKHHSNQYYADDAYIKRLYDAAASRIEKSFGKLKDDKGNVITIRGLDDILSLSPESLKALKDYAPALWDYVRTVGEYDKSEYWDNAVEQAGAIEELTKKINESLTQTTEDNIFDYLLEELYKLADGAEDAFDDIADYWQKMVNRMVISNVIGEELKDKITKWYKELADVQAAYNGESVESLTVEKSSLEAQLANLRKEQEEHAEKMQEYEKKSNSYVGRNDKTAYMYWESLYGKEKEGYDSNQELINVIEKELEKLNQKIAKGTITEEEYNREMERLRQELYDIKNGAVNNTQKLIDEGMIGAVEGKSNSDKSAGAVAADKITYEQADEGIGILRAIQIATEQIRDRMPDENGGGMSLARATSSDIASYGDSGLRDISSDIRDYTVNSYLELVEIQQNTAAIIKPINTMRDDIAEMKRDIHDRL